MQSTKHSNIESSILRDKLIRQLHHEIAEKCLSIEYYTDLYEKVKSSDKIEDGSQLADHQLLASIEKELSHKCKSKFSLLPQM
jgi:hypothetical protein